MSNSGFLRRALPFFVTFAVGIFIASFFVNVGLSRFRFEGRGWERHKRYERMASEFEQMRIERDQLRERVDTLESEKGRHCNTRLALESNDQIPELKLSVPPPMEQTAPRIRRIDK